MPRAKRIDYAGGHFHVFDRGVRRTDLFRRDCDRRLFLRLLAENCLERSWRCLAYCLMGNHYHFVLRTDAPGLSGGMHAIQGRYADYFNREYGFVGHVFEGRFKAKPIEHDAYLLNLLRYTVLNPVAALLCTRVEDWPWSSYAAMIGRRSHREWFDRTAALDMFGANEAAAISSYMQFIAAGEPHCELEDEQTFLRRRRDADIRTAYHTGTLTIRSLADAMGVSERTIKRALKKGHEGPGPS